MIPLRKLQKARKSGGPKHTDRMAHSSEAVRRDTQKRQCALGRDTGADANERVNLQHDPSLPLYSGPGPDHPVSFSMEASQAPAQKRRRVEEEVDYIRDTDVWLSDGNVVIVAEDKDDAPLKTYAFKCHRSVLARHSPVFDTLFTLPQPSEAGEEYDGAPVVRLPDPYKVLKSVLKMLYDPHGVPAPDREMKRWESKLSEIAGPLHLTAKYDLDGLHSRLSDVLEAFWPTYLHDWTQRSQTLVDWRLPVLGELTTLDFYLRPNPCEYLHIPSVQFSMPVIRLIFP
ncbi:hypothetical protein BDW22DRAFT_913517 [Trametopsis cervina]|nr:hypothetical protein BDW22DRAFT_913517 [Trametopsis cervina]